MRAWRTDSTRGLCGLDGRPQPDRRFLGQIERQIEEFRFSEDAQPQAIANGRFQVFRRERRTSGIGHGPQRRRDAEAGTRHHVGWSKLGSVQRDAGDASAKAGRNGEVDCVR
jgi:hypothetical protein